MTHPQLISILLNERPTLKISQLFCDCILHLTGEILCLTYRGRSTGSPEVGRIQLNYTISFSMTYHFLFLLKPKKTFETDLFFFQGSSCGCTILFFLRYSQGTIDIFEQTFSWHNVAGAMKKFERKKPKLTYWFGKSSKCQSGFKFSISLFV